MHFGGDEEDRTPDLRIANATLSQLSYAPRVHGHRLKPQLARSLASPFFDICLVFISN